jgi:hypothetical protein
MTGYRSLALRHDCATDGCYMTSRAPDWQWMDGAFPRGIMPSDVDGMVECGGRILLLEHKGLGAKGEPAYLHGGQLGMIRALARIPEVTVMVMRDRPDGDLDLLVFDGRPAGGWKRHTRDMVRHVLAAWATAAADGRAVS